LFKSAGLVARFDERKAVRLAENLGNYLKARGLELCVEDTLAQKMKTKETAVPLEKMKTDLVIAIGGDGTILRTCLSLPKPEPPILTVNMGIRGFLAEVEPKQALEAVDKCLKGEFTIEKCMKLSATANNIKFPDALNEVFVSTDVPAKILYARILKNGRPILNCQADGLMIATQTGSTGYSLSAGGPVLDPNVDAYVLTPVCALSVFRSIVFPAQSNLTVEVVRPEKILVVIDGQHRHIVSSKPLRLTVTSSKHKTSFIRLKESFYNRLKSRLLFASGGEA
jgi:NAD+ kinase